MNLHYIKGVFLSILFIIPTFVHAQLNTLGTAQNTITSVQNVVSNMQEKVNEIEAAVDYVKDNDLYKSLIDGKEFTFPIGVLPGDGDTKYALVINSVFMTPDGMYAEVFMKVQVSTNKTLYFLADKVPYSRSGGFAGDLRLYLLKTDSTQMGRGYNLTFTGLGNGLETGDTENCCFITFNCKGFKDVTLTGSLNFDRRTIVKDPETNEQLSLQYYVQGAAKISNFIIEFNNIPTFEFTNLPGFKCSMPKFTLDNSEIQNALEFSLPEWYQDSVAAMNNSTALVGDTSGRGNINVDGIEWRGIYIPSIIIDIPKAFKEKDPSEAVRISATDLIIDGNGLTVLASAEGVGGDLYTGKIKSWEYSIYNLEVRLIASSLSHALISGGITLPVSKSGKADQVFYGLILTKNIASSDISYSGYLDMHKSSGLINVQAFGVAKMKITTASISFNYSAGQFSPSAMLCGSINLIPKKKTTDTSAAAIANQKAAAGFGIDFNHLVLSTSAPYLDIDKTNGGYCRMSSGGQTMSNFPVSIDTINLIKAPGGQRLGLQIALTVQLQKSGSGKAGGGGFGGSTTFTIWTKRNPTTQKWQYDDFQLDKISIYVNSDAFQLTGSLSTFREDPVYGTGFCGKIDMTLMDGKLKVGAAAIFGRTTFYEPSIDTPIDTSALADSPASYRYWFVDAAVTLPVIPVAPMVGINGFNGGLYHHMQMDKPGTPPPANTTVDCQTTSGMKYTPNGKIHLGLMAGVGLQSVPTDAVFNGKITFGIEFNTTGGVNMLAFFGSVTIFTPPVTVPGGDALKTAMDVVSVDSLSAKKDSIKQETPKPEVGSVRVKWFTQYVFPTKTFTGDFDIFVDVINVVKGGGANKKAGHISVMFSPTKKYVYIGIPAEPISIEVIKLFTCEAYFCAGNELPVPPIMPLPSEFPDPPIDYNAMETGAGLSFGARVSLDGGFEGSADFWGCEVEPYANLWVSAGFDILITQTALPVICSSGEDRGINNWYATGQAFIMGGINVGCRYNCLAQNGDFTLVNASISAYLFAQLPNPSYMEGAVTVEFELLSIVSGEATLDVKFGETCVNPELNKNIVFIERITPASGSTNVSVSENIIVAFAKPIQKFTFSLPDETDGTKMVQYRGMVSTSDVLVTSNGKNIPCTLEWNSAKTQLTLIPAINYIENEYVTAIISVRLEYLNGSGQWVYSGKTEKDTSIFKTKFEPYTIAPANVQYAYPMPGMSNYYKNESNTGYIRLLSLPNKPMNLAPNYSFQVVFYEGSTEVARVTNVTVKNVSTDDQFSYPIPNNILQNSKAYTLKLIKVEDVSQTRSVGLQDTTMSMGTVAQTPKDTTILEYSFTSSKFGSFAQKMAYYNVYEVEVSGRMVVHQLVPNNKDVVANTAEEFSQMETYGVDVQGVMRTDKLVRAIGADFTNGLTIASSITNFPDSISYSYYSNTMYVQYNVFNELYIKNHKSNAVAISCTVNTSNAANCNAATGSSTFPKQKYYYKMGYFLPGKDIKTSEVVVGFDLPVAITF